MEDNQPFICAKPHIQFPEVCGGQGILRSQAAGTSMGDVQSTAQADITPSTAGYCRPQNETSDSPVPLHFMIHSYDSQARPYFSCSVIP